MSGPQLVVRQFFHDDFLGDICGGLEFVCVLPMGIGSVEAAAQNRCGADEQDSLQFRELELRGLLEAAPCCSYL